jgi:hypothetical protein
VIAFEKDLATTADTHELMAELVEASAGIAGAGERENGGGEDRAV